MMLFSAAIILLMCAMSVWAWFQLPDDARIPTHWNAQGEADGYSTKSTGLFLMPGLVAGFTILFAVLPAITPRKENMMKSMKGYKMCWGGIFSFLLFLHIVAVLTAMGKTIPLKGGVNIGVGLLFVVMGNWLGKVRSNFIMGVRTPWTLSSELSWNKTHRLAGKLFVIFGLVLLVAGIFFAAHPAMGKIFIGGLIMIVVVPSGYSWWVWKNDPDRQS